MGERYVFWMRLREDGIPDAARGGVPPLRRLNFKEPSRLEDGAPSRVRYAL